MGINSITLIGMAGVGKSTIGKGLAKELDVQLIDTDYLVEESQGLLIPDIIQQYGESVFKSIEKDCIIGVGPERAVISTGGSVIYDAEVMDHLKGISRIVYLHAGFDTINQRIQRKNARRLVTNGIQSLEELYDSRLPLYNKYADIVIDAEKDIKEIVDNIIQKIKG